MNRYLALLISTMVGMLSAIGLHAQTATLLPNAIQYFMDNNGKPLANGKVFFYVPPGTTPKTVWSDPGKTTPLTQPVQLGTSGRPTNPIYGDGIYRQVVKDQFNNTIWDFNTASTGGSGSSGGSGAAIGDGLAVGTIGIWESPGPLPNNYLYASGQEVSRTTYPQLLAALTLVQSGAICIGGSTTLSGLTDTSQIKAGAAIESSCVLPGTTVISRTTNSVVMSTAATVSVSAPATFFPFGNGNGATTFNVPALNGLYLLGRCNTNGVACTAVDQTTFGVDPNALNAGGGGKSRTIALANLPTNIVSATAGAVTVTLPSSRVMPTTQGTVGGNQTGGGAQPAGPTTTAGGSGDWVGVNSISTPGTVTVTSNNTGFGGVTSPLSVLPGSVTVNYIIKALPDATANISLIVLSASRLATTGPLPANTYNNGTSGVGATLTANANGALSIDGTAVNASDQVLIKNEVTQANNGIYTVAQVGDGSHPYILVRATNFDTPAEMAVGSYTLVFSGLTLNGTSWVLQQAVTTVGTDPVLFNQFSVSPNVNVASVITSVKDFGAKGDCTTDDTAAFQNAENAAFSSAGVGSILIPPTASCYRVSKINATNHSGVIWYGVGDQSVIMVTGKDSSNNWWDASGSSRRQFRNIKVIGDGVTIPDNLFVWACTGASCGTSGLLSGTSMDRVNINAQARVSFFYGYGYGCVAGAACPGNASLYLSNSTWTITNNVGSTTDYLTGIQAAPLHLTATNDRSVTSAYVSVLPGTATAWRATVQNMEFIDFSNGALKSNNSAMVLWNVTQFTSISGSYQCVCYTTVGHYSNTENITYIQPNFEQPNGAGGVTQSWIFMGQGVNTYTTILNGFSSDAAVAAVVFGPAISGGTLGGTWGLTIKGNNLNIEAGHKLIGIDPSGCGGWTAASNWIATSDIELQPAGVGIQTCGSVDSSTMIRGDTISVSVPGGATDSSFKIPGAVVGLANPTASVGLSAINGAAVTAMRSDAAPALSQAITPTWTGRHTFNGGITNTGTISAPAWLGSGILYQGNSPILTDTTSSGTVALAYNMAFGGGQHNATNPTTYTNYFNGFFADPVANTNVTFTSRWSLGAESARFGTTGTWAFLNGGNLFGTTAAAHCLTAGLNGLTNPAFDVDCSAATQVSGLRFFGAATGVAPGIVATDSASNVGMTINAKGTGQIQIGNVSTGGVSLAAGGGSTAIAGLTDISGASAGQIKFPATQNPSADANTLDDYKEGTFTPTISFGGASVGVTYATQVGKYTKIGNVVHYQIEVILTSKGSSVGTVAIGTLPYTSTANNTPAAVQVNNLAAGAITTIQATQSTASTTVALSRYAAGANTAMADTDFTNTSVIRISGFYFTS